MIPIIVATLMWVLLACLLVLRRGRGERTITYATATIAVAITLNIDAVYIALDELAGGRNLITLVADVALMTRVFLLGRGVMKAADRQPRPVRVALSTPALLIAAAAATVAFFLIEQHGTTTNFMLELGAQPAAAAYSIIHFSYYAVVLAAMASLAAHRVTTSAGVQMLPPTALLIGSSFGILLAGVVITMDVAHVSGNIDLMTGVSIAYGPLYLLTFVFLCVGFAAQPAARNLLTRSRARITRGLVEELDPVWQRATTVRPGISQIEDAAFSADGPETLLHRQVVEIRDAMIDTRVSFAVSDEERAIVDRAERHLLGGVTTETARSSEHSAPADGGGS